MAGVRGKSGRLKKNIFSRAYRISLNAWDADLLPFFTELEKLPADRRSVVLLAAIRDGSSAGKLAITHSETRKTSQAIDAIMSTFDQE